MVAGLGKQGLRKQWTGPWIRWPENVRVTMRNVTARNVSGICAIHESSYLTRNDIYGKIYMCVYWTGTGA